MSNASISRLTVSKYENLRVNGESIKDYLIGQIDEDVKSDILDQKITDLLNQYTVAGKSSKFYSQGLAKANELYSQAKTEAEIASVDRLIDSIKYYYDSAFEKELLDAQLEAEEKKRQEEEENKKDVSMMSCNEIKAYYRDNKHNMTASQRQYWHDKVYDCNNFSTSNWLVGVDGRKSSQYQEMQQRQQHIERTAKINSYRMEVGEEIGAGAIFIHYLFGKLVYSGIGNYTDENVYKTRTSNAHLRFGYGMSFTPMATNVTLYDYDYSTITESRSTSQWTIDFHAGMDYNMLYGDNFSLGLRTHLIGGHHLLFETFKWEGQIGMHGFIGHDNIKWYMSYDIGEVNLKHSSWLLANRDEEGRLRNTYSRFAYGPRFSWGDNKNHLDILFVQQIPHFVSTGFYYPDGEETSVAGFRINYWNHHQIEAFLEVFPNYKVGGVSSFTRDDEYVDSKMYLSLGVLRAFDIFTQDVGDHSYNSIKEKTEKKHPWVVSLFNPAFTFGNISSGSDTIISAQGKFNLMPFSVEKQISLPFGFSITGGVGWTYSNGIVGKMRNPSGTNFFGQEFNYDQRVSVTFNSIDLSIGAMFSPDIFGLDKYWVSYKFAKNYKLLDYELVFFDEEGKYDRETDIDTYFNKNASTREIAIGGDFVLTGTNSIRAGIAYFKQSNPIVSSTYYDSKMHGIKLILAIVY